MSKNELIQQLEEELSLESAQIFKDSIRREIFELKALSDEEFGKIWRNEYESTRIG